MKNSRRFLKSSVLLAWMCCASLAQASVQTWYVQGHLDPGNLGAGYDSRLDPLGSDTALVGSLSFNTNAPLLEMIPGSRWDLISSAAQGGAVSLQIGSYVFGNGSHILSEDISIYPSQLGERPTLNANGPLQGPSFGGLQTPGLDLLRIQRVDPVNPFAWFNPGSKPMLMPDLSLSSTAPSFDLFFLDPASGNYAHRLGLVTAISTTHFPAQCRNRRRPCY